MDEDRTGRKEEKKGMEKDSDKMMESGMSDDNNRVFLIRDLPSATMSDEVHARISRIWRAVGDERLGFESLSISVVESCSKENCQNAIIQHFSTTPPRELGRLDPQESYDIISEIGPHFGDASINEGFRGLT